MNILSVDIMLITLLVVAIIGNISEWIDYKTIYSNSVEDNRIMVDDFLNSLEITKARQGE